MPISGSVDTLTLEGRVLGGTQGLLRLSQVPASVASLVGKPLLGAGLLNVPGLYECLIPITGLLNFDVVLMPSAVAGAFTPSLVIYYANGRKPKVTVAGAAFAAATLQTIVMAPALRGEQTARLIFTIPGAGSINFDPTFGGADPNGATPAAMAEYNGKSNS